ncbi:MAG: glycoside hydrolase family 3 C-terminal domain-containing protein, partial [Clostridia bacterium]|nr:glycoside hydrolase family 3 C-terminal domain-containing protein [Clostridia bacterium]
FTNVTPRAAAYIPNVNFENVTSVEVEMETGSMWGGSLNIAYGQGGPTVAVISSPSTGTSGYTTVSGDYTGADGGYNGTRDMYISASAAVKDFSVSAFKSELDSADVILAYAGTIPKQAGLGDADSSESKDRETIDLPSHQAHVQAICNAYPDKTVVAMSTVGQINVEPFKDKCKAILWTSYNGQTQGTALGKILAGDINPSGRLTTTWYKNSDVQKMELYNNTNQTIDGITGKFTNYNIQPDGTNPGHTYMYYSGDAVYPFGYGLSYTNFAYSDMTVDKTETTANGKITASVKVKNTGTQKGSEVVQLYVSHPENTIFAASTPKKQLKGFEKVTLEPDEEKTVTFDLDISDMALFDEAAQKNIVPAGEYTICIGKNAADTSNSAKLTVSGTLDSTLKTVKAMPNGITLNGVVNEDGTSLTSKNTIDARVSAVMSDESFYDLASESVPASEPAEIKSGFAASMTYSNGKLKVKSNETVKADIIRATYSGSKLGSVEILKDKQLTTNETVSFDITASDGDKIMLWDSTDGMKPLAETITASNNSGSSVVTYTSSDDEIASVADDVIVSSGTKKGTAT